MGGALLGPSPLWFQAPSFILVFHNAWTKSDSRPFWRGGPLVSVLKEPLTLFNVPHQCLHFSSTRVPAPLGAFACVGCPQRLWSKASTAKTKCKWQTSVVILFTPVPGLQWLHLATCWLKRRHWRKGLESNKLSGWGCWAEVTKGSPHLQIQD